MSVTTLASFVDVEISRLPLYSNQELRLKFSFFARVKKKKEKMKSLSRFTFCRRWRQILSGRMRMSCEVIYVRKQARKNQIVTEKPLARKFSCLSLYTFPYFDLYNDNFPFPRQLCPPLRCHRLLRFCNINKSEHSEQREALVKTELSPRSAFHFLLSLSLTAFLSNRTNFVHEDGLIVLRRGDERVSFDSIPWRF